MKLRVIDDLNPEDVAMLQALYSRSAESVDTHLEKVRRVGSGKFMENFVVGYGHKSIADCGSTTIFIEDVSMLAAKAIQDWPLYNGQETSSRYVKMGLRRIEDPVGSSRSGEILRRWMEFYKASHEPTVQLIREKYPPTSEDLKTEKTRENYERAVNARSFDIRRAFLPAGITTQLSWHSNLRQAGDHLTHLTNHPSEEIRRIGNTLRSLLHEQYPSSGLDASLPSVTGVRKTEGQAAREAWERRLAETCTYLPTDGPEFGSTVDHSELAKFSELISTRPRGVVLPHFMSGLGQVTWRFLLDFGSFRDIQRHRNGVCRMPLLTTKYGFESWYINQLPSYLAQTAMDLIVQQTYEIEQVTDDPVVRQYYTALGFRMPCQVTYALPAAVYVLEIRSAKTVHATLRQAIHRMAAQFQDALPEVPIHVDVDSDDWDVRRGAQTIVVKT
jgi:thymidylate synthase ThyX